MRLGIILSALLSLWTPNGYCQDELAKDVTELSITIAGGSINGVYYPVALQLCNMVETYSPTTKCKAIITLGSAHNLALLTNNKVDFAMIQEDIAQGSQATRVKNSVLNNIKFVFNLFEESLTLIARPLTNITTSKDLFGKTIGVNLNGAGAKRALQTLIDSTKFPTPPNVVHVSELSMPRELCSGGLDAVAVFAAHPNNIISNILDSCSTQFVDIDGEAIEAITKKHPFYSYTNITPHTFNKEGQTVRSFGTRAMLFASVYTTKEKVEILRSVVGKYLDELKKTHQVLKDLDPYTLRDNKEFTVYE